MFEFCRSVAIAYNIPDLAPNSTNKDLPTSSLNLTQEVLVGIFNGTIALWNDPAIVLYNPSLAAVNKTIVVVVRADSSGTTEIFTRALSAFSSEWKLRYSHFNQGQCAMKHVMSTDQTQRTEFWMSVTP